MLSIVIPVFNEEESLETLHREISEVATANGYQIELIFVDDGSRDGSWEVIRRLAAERSAGTRDSLPPQLRQGRGPERRIRPRPAARSS